MGFDKPLPIAQSDMMMFSKYVDDDCILYVQDVDGNVLFSFEEVVSQVARGMVDGNLLWITAESWVKQPFGEYLDSSLHSSLIIVVDLDTKLTVLHEKMKNDDLLLFAKDGYCYFYDRGKVPGKRIDNSVNANIYYRHIKNWDEVVPIYQFDYQEVPIEAAINPGNHTIQFQLQPEGFSVSLDLRDVNDHHILWSVEIPFVTPELSSKEHGITAIKQHFQVLQGQV